MIVVETEVCAPWPSGDWIVTADRAVRGTIPHAAKGALLTSGPAIEVSIRLTSDEEVQTLNRLYRQQDKPTNVLSFPMVQQDLLESFAHSDANASGAGGEVLLGDIVLAHETCAREAAERGVPLEDHAAHLIVHGTLHLLGYDHMNDHEADAMEAIERKAMTALGLHDPYPIED